MVSKVLWPTILVALGLGVAGAADVGFNDARLVYALLGRDRLVAACLPELQRGLEARGFAPTSVEFEARPSMSLALGGPRGFGAQFSFQDGPAETRVDGVMACVVGPDAVHVEFRTSARPVRIG